MTIKTQIALFVIIGILGVFAQVLLIWKGDEFVASDEYIEMQNSKKHSNLSRR